MPLSQTMFIKMKLTFSKRPLWMLTCDTSKLDDVIRLAIIVNGSNFVVLLDHL